MTLLVVNQKIYVDLDYSCHLKCLSRKGETCMKARTAKPNIRKTAAPLAALLVVAALLGACVQAAGAEEEQTLIMSLGGSPDGSWTDPTISSKLMPDLGGTRIYQIYTHFSPLLSLDGDSNIIPWMAESYEVSDDYRTIVPH